MTQKRKNRVKLGLRVGDEVQVICGKDKGQRGKISKIDADSQRVIVEGVNKVTRHVKPRNPNESGEIVVTEAPIHYSNVLLYSKHAGKGVRFRIERSEQGKKINRICTKTNQIIE